MKKLMLFHARYCGKCHAADKRIKKALIKGDLQFEYQIVDIEVEKDLVKAYNVIGIPTLICLEDNKELKRIKGTILPEHIKGILE